MEAVQKIKVFAGIILLLLCALKQSIAQHDGEKLFKGNCASCHAVSDKKLTGPGLKGINEKRSKEWLLKWIKNSSALIESGDPDAVAIFNEFNRIMMPPNNLQDGEITAILGYIKDANLPQVSDAKKKPVMALQSKPFEWTVQNIIAAVFSMLVFILLVWGVYAYSNMLLMLEQEKIYKA